MDEDEIRFPTWESESYTKSSRPKKITNPNSSLSLVKYFEDEIQLRLFSIGTINRAALMGTFSRWLREGIRPDQIRGMVKVYINNDQFHTTPGPHWKKFLYHRDTLLERTTTTEYEWDDNKKEQEFEWD